MKCCGQTITTNFCSSCGKANDSPLISLLAHITKTTERHTTEAENLQNSRPTDEDHTRSKVKTASKWESWRVALLELMEYEILLEKNK